MIGMIIDSSTLGLFLIFFTFIMLVYFPYSLIKFFKTKKEIYLLPILGYIVLYFLVKYLPIWDYIRSSDYLNIALLISIVIFILLFLYRKFYLSTLILSLFVIRFLLVLYVENDIYHIALKKYQVEPNYVKIDFNIDGGVRRNHSVFEKEGRLYHWSFYANDFVE